MKLYAFLADGFETVEALAVVDVLRRGGVTVCTVSVGETRRVVSAHQIPVEADRLFSECDFSDADMLFLPGGLKGTLTLEAHEGLSKLIDKAYEQGRYLAAICAAPSILGHHNILDKREATCYPGFEKDLYGAVISDKGVVVSDKIITAKGMGKSVDMGLTLLAILKGEAVSDEIREKIQY